MVVLYSENTKGSGSRMIFDDKMYSILDCSLEIIIAFNQSGKVVYANDTAKSVLDYGPQLFLANIEDVLPGNFKVVDGHIMSDWKYGDTIQETMVYRGNRTCFLCRVRIVEYFSDARYFICYAYDISRRALAERKLAQTQAEAEAALKVKSEFVSNITHELKTPVNGILGNTQELLRIEDDPVKKRTLKLVERGCYDMNSIIGNVLDFSKLESGKFELDPREFNFREMMDYVKTNHIHKINEKGLEFFINISPEIPEIVIGDDLRVAQVLNNLISNAIKFTHVGKIMVEVVKTAQFEGQIELFFFVIDTGIGIALEDLDKLFKSFSQVDASISRQYGGTGLGLNICKQLVELMNGDINVESEVNKGSVFSFHIWLDLPESESEKETVNVDVEATMQNIRNIQAEESGIVAYGTEENLEELNKKMQKLILCMEMDNWEKAEMFAESIKQLTIGAPKEIKTTVLKLKMAVQKEDYDNATAMYEELKTLV